jgi:hypothetical protein
VGQASACLISVFHQLLGATPPNLFLIAPDSQEVVLNWWDRFPNLPNTVFSTNHMPPSNDKNIAWRPQTKFVGDSKISFEGGL